MSAPIEPQSSFGLILRDEAAARLGVSVKTLRKFVRQGKLRAVRYSRTSVLRFRQVDLDRFIESQLRHNPPAVDPGHISRASCKS
jgi:excisionase family DNA binding protein